MLARPCPQIHVLAALRTKWAIGIGRRVDAFAAAGRSAHEAWLRIAGWVLPGHVEPSGAESEFELGVVVARLQAVSRFLAHQAHRDHQAVAADLRYQSEGWVQPQSQQLEGATLRQRLLQL